LAFLKDFFRYSLKLGLFSPSPFNIFLETFGGKDLQITLQDQKTNFFQGAYNIIVMLMLFLM